MLKKEYKYIVFAISIYYYKCIEMLFKDIKFE